MIGEREDIQNVYEVLNEHNRQYKVIVLENINRIVKQKESKQEFNQIRSKIDGKNQILCVDLITFD